MSPKSEFFENLDIAFSDVVLRDGHTDYQVMETTPEIRGLRS
jgi:hypothetical protein